MSKIAILGGGNFGTALAQHLARINKEVILYSIEPEVVQDINTRHHNTKYCGNIHLLHNITATQQISEAVQKADALFIVVPSFAVAEVTKNMLPHLDKNTIIVSTAKGLTPEEKRMSQLLEELLPKTFHDKIVALSGPSIAGELLMEMPTAVALASKKIESAKHVSKYMNNKNFTTEINTDVIGVELGGFLKNIVAILSGISKGLVKSVNLQAVVVTQAYAEVMTIAKAMGAKQETLLGLSGMGDLLVTCFSTKSRNNRMGQYLATGLSVEEAKEAVGQTVEGVHATKIAYQFAQKKKINLPLLEKLYKVLYENRPITQDFFELNS